MARASGIWIVTNSYGGPDLILGAFTVKNELIAWLERQPDPTCYQIIRVRDGNLKWTAYPDWEKPPERFNAIDLLRGG